MIQPGVSEGSHNFWVQMKVTLKKPIGFNTQSARDILEISLAILNDITRSVSNH